MLQTIEKAAQVLNLFTPENPEWGVSQVAQKLGMPKSSAHAFLNSLAEVGLLYRFVTGRYRLGFRILTLSQALLHNTPWREEAAPLMESLRHKTGETVHLSVLAGGELVTVNKLDGNTADAAPVSQVGAVVPSHCSAHGKMLLALRPWAFVSAVLDQHGMTAYTENTIVSRDELKSELLKVRKRGFAYDIEEYRAGLCCVAAPVRNHNGETIVALGISLPSERFHTHKDALRTAVIETADAISQRIGFDADFSESGRYWWTSVEGRDELKPVRKVRFRRSGDE